VSKGLDPARLARSLTEALNRPWGQSPPGVHGCGHTEHVLRCVYCALENSHRATNRRMLDKLLAGERDRLRDEGAGNIAARRARARGKAHVLLVDRVQDSLHAAGVVEVEVDRRAVPVAVSASGMFGRELREDEACEIIQEAQEALDATREYQTHVLWDRVPPVLRVAGIPDQVGLLGM
jgi:hypothetical protein